MKANIDTEQRITLPHAAAPEPGEPVEVAPGIIWLRLPLPFRLNHVNIWLLEEADGWTAIDCGIDSEDVRAVWHGLRDDLLKGKPPRRVVGTHGHTDHVGLASWIAESFDVPLIMTLAEWQSARLRHADTAMQKRDHIKHYLAEHGCDEAMIAAFGQQRRSMTSYFGPQPMSFTRMREGDELRLGGRNWRVMVCGGHADEHASLYCAEDGILIAGDQILQRISPMIGVFPVEPEADPLSDYLASLPRFLELPGDLLVLPSHGLPFYGLHHRARELEQHHHDRLDTLAGFMRGSLTGADCTRLLFPQAVTEGHGRHAFAETLAHLHHLVSIGRAERTRSADGGFSFALKG